MGAAKNGYIKILNLLITIGNANVHIKDKASPDSLLCAYMIQMVTLIDDNNKHY